MKQLQDIPLRERKNAKTKLAILDAAIRQMSKRPLEDIPVKDMCERASVSEVTFYNYFHKKTDLLDYYLKLLSIELSWRVANKEGLSNFEKLALIYDVTADKISANPTLMGEMIVHITRNPGRIDCSDVGDAEKLIAFKDFKGVTETPNRCIGELLRDLIVDSVKSGELPENTEVDTALLLIASVLYGVAITLLPDNPDKIKKTYAKQLKLIWRGLGGTTHD